MQLAITVLGDRQTPFIEPILFAINRCQCDLVEIRMTDLAEITAILMLIDGNWNHVAKLESMLEMIEKQFRISIQKIRQEKTANVQAGLPYLLEAMSSNHNNTIMSVTQFLSERNVVIREIKGTRYQTPYVQTPIFLTKFVIVIPPEVRLIQMRDDFLEFCDEHNLDAIFEPLKQ